MALVAGIRIYAAFITPHRLTCIANEFNFGCFTPLGWAISLAAAVLLVVAVCVWERFRGS
jgi:hypothetical protein